MKLNLEALGNYDMSNLVKKDYNNVINETIHHFSIVELANSDKMVIVVTIEKPSEFFYANGTLKQFLLDNVDILNKNDKNQYIMYDYEVKVTCKGRIETKNGYMFTTWEIIVPD